MFLEKDIEKFIVPNNYLDIPDLMNLKNNGKRLDVYRKIAYG